MKHACPAPQNAWKSQNAGAFASWLAPCAMIATRIAARYHAKHEERLTRRRAALRRPILLKSEPSRPPSAGGDGAHAPARLKYHGVVAPYRARSCPDRASKYLTAPKSPLGSSTRNRVGTRRGLPAEAASPSRKETICSSCADSEELIARVVRDSTRKRRILEQEPVGVALVSEDQGMRVVVGCHLDRGERAFRVRVDEPACRCDKAEADTPIASASSRPRARG